MKNTIIDSDDRGQKVIESISFEKAADLLGHINTLVNAKYDTYLTYTNV